MQQFHLSKPQTVNACTLISIGVIEAILSSSSENEMHRRIKEIHQNAQVRYQKDFSGKNDGGGILEVDACQKYFSNIFLPPNSDEVLRPSSEINLSELISNRNTYEDINEFILYNGEAIDAIGICDIDWANISLEELKQKLEQESKIQSSLQQQFLGILSNLTGGMTLRSDGHTLSVVAKGDYFYSYDSLTGILSRSTTAFEMADHLITKMNVANQATIYFFSLLQNHVNNFKYNENSEIIGQIKEQLDILATRAPEFEIRYPNTFEAISRIHDEVSVNLNLYLENALTLEDFQKQAQQVIQDQGRKLENFPGREFKKVVEILVNLLLLIASLGTTYLVSGRFSLFRMNTDSSENINQLQSLITNMKK